MSSKTKVTKNLLSLPTLLASKAAKRKAVEQQVEQVGRKARSGSFLKRRVMTKMLWHFVSCVRGMGFKPLSSAPVLPPGICGVTYARATA